MKKHTKQTCLLTCGFPLILNKPVCYTVDFLPQLLPDRRALWAPLTATDIPGKVEELLQLNAHSWTKLGVMLRNISHICKFSKTHK